MRPPHRITAWAVALLLSCACLPARGDALDLAGGASWEGASPSPLLVDVIHNGQRAGTAIIARHPFNGDFYVGLDTLTGTLLIERDGHRLDTPLGSVSIPPESMRDMDGQPMAPARTLSALLASDIRFNSREYVLEVDTPWPRQAPAGDVIRPTETVAAEHTAAPISLSQMRTEIWHRQQQGRDLSRSRADLEGRLGQGLWRVRARDWVDGDTRIEDYQWLYPGEQQRLLLGHQRFSASPVFGATEMTGGQYAWTNRPQAVFTPYLRASTLTGLPMRALRTFTGEGPPGGRAELRVDGRRVAEDIIALDGRWEFREVDLPGQGVSLVEVWLYERGGNGAPVAVEDFSGFYTRQLYPGGTVLVQGGLGQAGNLIEDGSDDAVGFFSATLAPRDGINLEAAGQRDLSGDYFGAGLGFLAGPLGYVSLDGGQGEGHNAWRGEFENQIGRVFWRGQWRQEDAGWREREQRLEDRGAELGFMATHDLSVSLIGRDYELGDDRTRFLRPALAWRVNSSVYLRARPDRDGRYLANANWRLTDHHSLTAAYHRSESGARWDYRPARQHLVSLSYTDRRGVGERTALVWQRFGWQVRDPGWAVGAMAGNGTTGFLLRGDYEALRGIRFRAELLRDPLGPLRRDGKPDTVVTLSLVANLLFTGSGLARGQLQQQISTRGNVAGRVRLHDPDDRRSLTGNGGSLGGLAVLINGQRAGRTDPDGSYSVVNLRPGIYAVRLDPEGLPLDLIAPERAVQVEVAHGAVTRVDFELRRSLGMGGLITDNQGEPVAGAGLRLLDTHGEIAALTRADGFGRWMVTGLRPGRYRIEWHSEQQWRPLGEHVLGEDWLIGVELLTPDGNSQRTGGTAPPVEGQP